MATYDQYLPFNNIKLNEDYILIKAKQKLDDKLVTQLAVEPVYDSFDNMRKSMPSRSLKNMVSRDQHPGDHNSVYIPESQQLTMYENFKKNTRGWGEIGKGLCNMKFLS